MNKEIFKKATMSNRLDLAEFALTLAVIDREPWAVKFMLSTQGKNRGYVEKQQIENVSQDSEEMLEKLAEILPD